MAGAQQDLAAMLASKIYPVLLSDTPYCEFLFGAGIFGGMPNGASGQAAIDYVRNMAKSGVRVESLSAENRANLAEQARKAAHIAMAHLGSLDAVRVGSANARLHTASTRLYRVWDSSSRSAAGVWWFEQKLLDLCRREAGPSQADRFAWLRDACAVCFDWSAFDRIAELSLHPGEECPVIEAMGLPMRAYSKPSKYTPTKYLPWNNPKVDMKDYWAKLGTTLGGGFKQTFLPFIPEQRIRKLAAI